MPRSVSGKLRTTTVLQRCCTREAAGNAEDDGELRATPSTYTTRLGMAEAGMSRLGLAICVSKRFTGFSPLVTGSSSPATAAGEPTTEECQAQDRPIGGAVAGAAVDAGVDAPLALGGSATVTGESTTHGDAAAGPVSEGTVSASYAQARAELRNDHTVELVGVAAAHAAEAILKRKQREEEHKRRRAEARAREDALRKAVAAWERLLASKKGLDVSSKHLRSLARAGVPSQLRGRVWSALIGNSLQVTPELFQIFKQHASTARALVHRERELLAREMAAARQSAQEQRGQPDPAAGGAADAVGQTTASPAAPDEAVAGDATETGSEVAAADTASGSSEAASPASPRQGRRSSLAAAPEATLLGKEGTVALIELDIPRTFPDLAFFAAGGPLHEPLRDVLEAYTCFRPDVGYVQGMSFLAAMLLLNMGADHAFAAFANLLSSNIYFDFFRLDMDRMRVHLAAYEHLLEENLPALAQHLKAEGVESDQYVISWLLTLFTRALPLDTACRLWDVYLVHRQADDLFLWRIAIGLLTVLQSRLLGKDMAGILTLLFNVPSDVTAEDLLAAADKVRLTRRGFDALLQRMRNTFNRPARAEPDPTALPASTEAEREGGWLAAPAFGAAHAEAAPTACTPTSPGSGGGDATPAGSAGGGFFSWVRSKMGGGGGGGGGAAASD